VGETAKYVARLEAYRPSILVDGTGVGRPIVQQFRNQAGLNVVHIHLHNGADVKYVPEEERFNVPVRTLVAAAQVYLEQRRLLIAAGLRYADALKHELSRSGARFLLRRQTSLSAPSVNPTGTIWSSPRPCARGTSSINAKP
jgi:hypothetical protein